MEPTTRTIAIGMDTYWVVRFQRGCHYMPDSDKLKCSFCNKKAKEVMLYKENQEDSFISCLNCIDEANKRKIGKTEYKTLTIKLFQNV